MGVGGHFWDVLKPYVKYEDFDFLRNKKVAVDLSYWIVQHETAVKNASSVVHDSHLRLTFLRTVNLFAKFGAFPVFIVDGTSSPLKSQAQIARFFRSSGIDESSLPAFTGNEVPVERNGYFQLRIQQCKEILNLLGMPVLKANGEAEALCAQLNSKGMVDACITSDSDAFLYGAKCVIKSIRPNSEDPFECYHMTDIEVGLRLKREHLIAISLLVGTDHSLNGVQGVGIETALRFVKSFDETEVLTRLQEIGAGLMPPLEAGSQASDRITEDSDEIMPKLRTPHCSLCGHPGNKTAHHKSACEFCCTSEGVGCNEKPPGFQCDCASCNMERKQKEQKNNQNWHLRVCKKIAMEHNFPNNEIIDMYLSDKNGNDAPAPSLSWTRPSTDLLTDFLGFHLPWTRSYIRKMILPVLSTILLREMASNPTETLLLNGQFEFDSIHRVKVRYGHQFYVVKWKRPGSLYGHHIYQPAEEPSSQPQETAQMEDVGSAFGDEPEVPQILVDDEGCFILTDEDMGLVEKAFPEEVNDFLEQKTGRQSKRRIRSSHENSDGPNVRSTQLTLPGFYHSAKCMLHDEKDGGTIASGSENTGIATTEKRTRDPRSKNLPKCVRRRLLFV